jgi:ketosteroid isomerase-like protein
MPDPKDVVRRFFATLGTGDFAAIGEFFTDDSVWQVNDVARGLPAQRGRTAIIDDFLQPVREGLFAPGDPKVEIRRLIGEDDWVVAETTARGTVVGRLVSASCPQESHDHGICLITEVLRRIPRKSSVIMLHTRLRDGVTPGWPRSAAGRAAGRP